MGEIGKKHRVIEVPDPDVIPVQPITLPEKQPEREPVTVPARPVPAKKTP